MQQRKKMYFLLVLGMLAVLLPAVAKAATTIGNNVSVGGTLGVTGATTLSSTLGAGATTLSSLTVSGATILQGTVTLSSTLSSSIIPTTANTYNLGSYAASFASLYASSTVYAASSTIFNPSTTSTVYISSGTSGMGGQLVLKGANGTCYAVYIGNYDGVGRLGVTSTALTSCY